MVAAGEVSKHLEDSAGSLSKQEMSDLAAALSELLVMEVIVLLVLVHLFVTLASPAAMVAAKTHTAISTMHEYGS